MVFVEGEQKWATAAPRLHLLVEQGRESSKIEEQVSFSVSRTGSGLDEEIISTALETRRESLFASKPRSMPSGTDDHGGEVRDGQMHLSAHHRQESHQCDCPARRHEASRRPRSHRRRQPLQPRRNPQLAGLTIGFNEIAQIELAAANYEPTRFWTILETRLRIHGIGRLPQGNVLRAICGLIGKAEDGAGRTAPGHL